MVINTNLSALNAWRALETNNTNTQKALQKLSSGYRINSAADDAAGLAISEKMKAQIAGLNMAQRNAQDGISLIQTAEGALNETQSILQRMNELAVQSANGANTDTERAAIQKEMDQLAQEIGRIGQTTEFNTQKLLDGTFKSVFQIGANENQNLSLQINNMSGAALGITGNANESLTTSVIAGTSATFADGTYSISLSGTTYELLDSSNNVVGVSSDGVNWLAGTDTSATTVDTFTLSTAAKVGTVTISGGDKNVTVMTSSPVKSFNLDAGTYTFDSSASVLKDSSGNIVATTSDGITFKDRQGNTVLTLNPAATNGAIFTVGGIDVSTQAAANSAITKIQDAINQVSMERSKLGAYQNRLEHTINNLGTASENLTAANSRIRDVDMAKEMMEFTKDNILNQAATAMLAQANQQPQTVLQLLR